MKRSLAIAAVTLVACAAFGAVYAYFSPSLNAVTGETGNKTERMINDSPRKAHVRAACGAAGGALAGLGLVLYAARVRRRPSDG